MKAFASKRFSLMVVVAGLLATACVVEARDLTLPVSGNVLGSVEDPNGMPQMGATIQLFNKFERLIARTTTGSDGRFGFADLPADLYSIRVSLVSFLPVSRDKIAVKPGLDSVLQIHLASLLSSIEVAYILPSAAMSNDWKWVLRSSPATRAITRYVPDAVSTSQAPELLTRIFSETHAMVSLSGGDSSLVDVDSGQADLGTGFLVSTNFLGKNQLQLGGNFAQSSPMGPSAMGLVAIYSHNGNSSFGQAPEVTLSVSQLGIVAGPGTASGQGFGEAAAGVRAMSLSIYQTLDPVDNVHLEYGMTGESVNFVQHTSRLSPFARLTISAGAAGKLIASYSNGGRPDELIAHQVRDGEVEQDVRGDDPSLSVSTLSRLPQIVYDDHRLKLERTQSYELGYQKSRGSRTYSVSAFHEAVSNGRINVGGNTSELSADDLLSDGVSKTLIYDIGSYQRSGLVAAARQQVKQDFGLTAAYGRIGGFAADPTGAAESTRNGFLDKRTYNIATVNLDARLPKAGTKFIANYGWAANRALIPTHILTTQSTSVSPGFNILIRQPLPQLFGMPGHLEITADLRNLLAQGYLPIGGSADGHNLLALQAPRAVRGGVNFIF